MLEEFQLVYPQEELRSRSNQCFFLAAISFALSLDPSSSNMLCMKFMDLKLLRARHGQLIAFQPVPASRLQFCMRAGTFFSTLFS